MFVHMCACVCACVCVVWADMLLSDESTDSGPSDDYEIAKKYELVSDMELDYSLFTQVISCVYHIVYPGNNGKHVLPSQ